MKIPASELPKQPDGAIYHLNLHPEELADNIVLVGDPGRVEMFSKMFDTIELKRQNRELVTHTGLYKGKRVTVLSTGMGTDNIDIVLNELDALANIDLKTNEVLPEHRTLKLVRVGTSGALQDDIEVGTPVASAFGLGIDGVLNFYDSTGCLDKELTEAFIQQTSWSSLLPHPYCTPASPDLLETVAHDMRQGITISAPGFFGPQGRQVRAKLMYPELNHAIEAFDYKGHKVTNMEMECSAIYGLSKVLGHQALTVCLIIANRVTGRFLDSYHDLMENLGRTVLDRI
jgi:uridine phosphorylase